jgi:hypothetical protein
MRRVPFGGSELLALEPESLTLLLCIHGSKHHWSRLAWIADLAGIVRNHPELNWTWLLDEVRRLRCRRMFLLGIWLAMELLDTSVPDRMLTAFSNDPVIAELGDEVCEGIFQRDEVSWAGIKNVSFLRRVRESLQDQVTYVVRRAFTPTEKEWCWQAIPRPFCFLYVPLRGTRLAFEHGAKFLDLAMLGLRH